jgi:hypothetical protein
MLSIDTWKKIWDYVERIVVALERIADTLED